MPIMWCRYLLDHHSQRKKDAIGHTKKTDNVPTWRRHLAHGFWISNTLDHLPQCQAAQEVGMIEVHREEDDMIIADIECDGDGCNESFMSAEHPDWQTMIEALKGDGWRIWKSGENWYHFCRRCK